MIKIFKTFGGYDEISKIEKGCWVSATQPTQEELEKLVKDFKIPIDSLQDILDADEMPRLEFDDDYSLVIMRIPVESPLNSIPYHTIPLGIFITKNCVLTLCNQENEILHFKQGMPLNDAYSFILHLFERSGGVYLKYLKIINQQTTVIEKDLEKSIKNSELNKLLKMEKCLVYFITSIKSNEIVLAKLRNSKKITTEINIDLLEDAMIENKQALEMAQIYSDILSGMMDAFASIISNNLNVIIKKLTLVSIVILIPTFVVGIFGMNVPNGMEQSWWAIASIIFVAFAISTASVIFMRKQQWF